MAVATLGRPAKLQGQEAEIVAAYSLGASLADLQQRFEVSKSPLKRILVEAQATRASGRPRMLKALDAPAIIAAYKAGESMANIGRRYGVSHHPVARLLRDHRVLVLDGRRQRWQRG